MTAHEHPFVPEELMAYADGELTAIERARVAAHLEQCGSCRDTVAAMRQVSDDLGQWTVEPPPPMTAPAGVDRPRKRVWWWLFGPTWNSPNTWAAAAVLAIAVVAVWVGGKGVRRSSADTAGVMFRSQPAAAQAGSLDVPPALADGSAMKPAFSSPVPALRSEAEQAQVAAGNTQPLSRAANVIRTITLSIVAADVDAARPAIDDILRRMSGFVGTMQVTGTRNEGRTIRASLRIPSARVDEAVASLRGLGKVVDESHSGDDVTEQLVDIDARLLNNRNTEKRLTDVLQNRTGKVGDILEVEREIARVRSEIEQLDARRKNLSDRVSYATVALFVSEERKAALDPGHESLGAQLRNALVDGLQGAFDSAVGVFLALLRIAPVLVLWAAILWWPVRRTYRALRF